MLEICQELMVAIPAGLEKTALESSTKVAEALPIAKILAPTVILVMSEVILVAAKEEAWLKSSA
jgi:hypothetical protein